MWAGHALLAELDADPSVPTRPVLAASSYSQACSLVDFTVLSHLSTHHSLESGANSFVSLLLLLLSVGRPCGHGLHRLHPGRRCDADGHAVHGGLHAVIRPSFPHPSSTSRSRAFCNSYPRARVCVRPERTRFASNRPAGGTCWACSTRREASTTPPTVASRRRSPCSPRCPRPAAPPSSSSGRRPSAPSSLSPSPAVPTLVSSL